MLATYWLTLIVAFPYYYVNNIITPLLTAKLTTRIPIYHDLVNTYDGRGCAHTHRGQPIDCVDGNSSSATKIYLDISTRFLKCFFAKSVLSHNSDTYLDVMRCHQLLEGVSLVNHQSRNIDSRFRIDFGAVEVSGLCAIMPVITTSEHHNKDTLRAFGHSKAPLQS